MVKREHQLPVGITQHVRPHSLDVFRARRGEDSAQCILEPMRVAGHIPNVALIVFENQLEREISRRADKSRQESHNYSPPAAGRTAIYRLP